MRDLKGRIGSVASSEKITGAMKMISSAKMHKAESALRRVRPFRDQIQNTIDHLISADAEYSSLIQHDLSGLLLSHSFFLSQLYQLINISLGLVAGCRINNCCA